jgi:hypothetical protein
MKDESSESNVSVQVQELRELIEVLMLKLSWLEDNDKEQQLQIDNHTRRIMNDFPVEPWNDD